MAQFAPSAHKVKALALAHMAKLDERISELEAIKRVLTHLAAHCHGDKGTECPIVDGLSAQAGYAETGCVPPGGV